MSPPLLVFTSCPIHAAAAPLGSTRGRLGLVKVLLWRVRVLEAVRGIFEPVELVVVVCFAGVEECHWCAPGAGA